MSYGLSGLLLSTRERLTWRAEPDLRRLPRARGRPPAFGGSGLYLLAICNEAYLETHASYLARSLDRHAPGNTLHIHLVNPSPSMRGEVEALQAGLARTRIGWTAEQVDFTGRPAEFERAYCASIRLVRATQAMIRGRHPLLVLDADTLVRAPLDGLTREVGTADIAVRTRLEDRRVHLRFALGTLYLGWSPRTLDFMRRVSVRLARAIDSGTLRWFGDQTTFYEIYEEDRSREDAVRIASLPPGFADWEFGEESVIWAGKGPRKDTDERYLSHKTTLRPPV